MHHLITRRQSEPSLNSSGAPSNTNELVQLSDADWQRFYESLGRGGRIETGEYWGCLILTAPLDVRNITNCLTNNLLESESLPQIRNLLEMSEINPAGLKLESGVENEADDEGTEEATAGRYRQEGKHEKGKF